jgi:hypothetical protein
MFIKLVHKTLLAVRRQNIWHIRRRKLAESGPRLGFGLGGELAV